MNERLKILSKRLELASNAVVTTSWTGAGLLLFKDGEILFKNATFASVLIILGITLYVSTTMVLMGLAERGLIKSEETDDGGG